MKRHVLHLNSLSEVVYNDHGHITGFALRAFKKDEVRNDVQAQHYYLVIVLQGEVMISCVHYTYKRVGAGSIAFIPKGSRYRIDSCAVKSKALFFAFDATLMKMDEGLFNYFVKNAPKKPYEFTLLHVNEQMQKVVDMIVLQMTGTRKIHLTEVCSIWNTIIFFTLATFYKRAELLDFFRPMMHSQMDFRTFIDNNFYAAGGKVSILIKLSGLSERQFLKKFNEVYGSNPKVWLTKMMKSQIINVIKRYNVTPTELAKMANIPRNKLFKFCRQNFGCTATELIAQVREV